MSVVLLQSACASSIASRRHTLLQQIQSTQPQEHRPAVIQQRAAAAVTLLSLRGGADDGALPDPPKPPADKDALQLPSDAADADEDGAVALSPIGSCMAGVKKIIGMLLSLLSPSHDYAKVGSDLLGNSEQQCGYAADDESWRTQRKKLNEVELQAATRKRVLRDLRLIKRETDLGLEVEDCECLTDWVIKLVGAKGTVYENEIYRLRVRFHADYPSQPPEVTFMRPAPVHEHIYSDGKICAYHHRRRVPPPRAAAASRRHEPPPPAADFFPARMLAACSFLAAAALTRAAPVLSTCPLPTTAQASTSSTTTGTRSSTSSRSASRFSRCSRAQRARSARRTTTPPSSCRRGRRRGICSGSSMMTSARV